MVLGIQEKLINVRDFLEKEVLAPIGVSGALGKGGKVVGKGGGEKLKNKLRMRNIFAAPLVIQSDFRSPVHHKTPDQEAFIRDALRDEFVFATLKASEQKKFVEAMESCTVKSGTTVIRQGDVGDYFYVIQDGIITFHVDGNNVGQAERGGSFGELALLYDCPRAATCKAETDCTLWRLDQKTFRLIRASHAIQDDRATQELLKKVDFLKGLDSSYLDKIADALSKVQFAKGETIAKKHQKGNTFYIIQEGYVKATNISVNDTKYADVTFGPGDHFGERAILTNEPVVGDAIATTDVEALCLSSERFRTLFGDFDDLIQRSNDKKIISAIPVFAKSDLTPSEIESLASLIKDVEYEKGKFVLFMERVVTEKGHRADPRAIYFIRSGKITLLSKDGNIQVLTKGQYFGEDTLVMSAQEGKAMERTIQVIEDCKLGMLTLESIQKVLVDISILGKGRQGHKKPDTTLSLDSLKKYRILGAGTFGQVWLVSDKTSKTPYALKIQYKRELIEYGQVDGVIREKNIMSSLDHPFIIKLVGTYQDNARLYMLQQLLQGGELFSVLHTNHCDGVPESSAKFYAAGVLEGLSYMHRRHIVHRDLKGENVLLDSDGYCVLIDLGFAKYVPDKTYTFCGTPLFIAPEVIMSKGHDHGADIWSFGVLIYEMIVGQNPFYHNDENIDQMALFKRIVRGKFSFPDNVEMSPESKNLIQNLLITDPARRLGCSAREDMDIREHPWFVEVDFRKLFRKEITAPWVPDIKDPLDVSNFDTWENLEKEKKHPKPLSAKEQQLFEGF